METVFVSVLSRLVAKSRGKAAGKTDKLLTYDEVKKRMHYFLVAAASDRCSITYKQAGKLAFL